MILLNKTIRLFLDSIGRREEYEFYLNKFHSGQSPCFSILCPDRATLEQTADVLAFDLQFLLKLELTPLILLSGEDARGGVRLLRKHGGKSYKFLTVKDSINFNQVLEFVRKAQAAEKLPVMVAPRYEQEEILRILMGILAKRVHFIRAQGGLHTVAGEELFYYYTQKEGQPALTEEDRLLAERAGAVLKAVPGAHVSVTSCINLMEEIFTVKGAGTMFRKGSEIKQFGDRDQVDLPRLHDLLEASFKRKLALADPFEKITDFIVEGEYRGAALLEKRAAGHYLSKFSVGAEARGEGLAQELWRVVIDTHDSIFWRSRKDNPINHWYDRMADGYHTSGKWQIFWRGIDAAQIPSVVDYCLTRPEDFENGS
ncbi:hypothetical protein ACFLQY_02660 [Verrucomicrobiota bacterium]